MHCIEVYRLYIANDLKVVKNNLKFIAEVKVESFFLLFTRESTQVLHIKMVIFFSFLKEPFSGIRINPHF